MKPLDFVNLMSAFMTVLLALLLLRMIWKLDLTFLARKKAEKTSRRPYLGM